VDLRAFPQPIADTSCSAQHLGRTIHGGCRSGTTGNHRCGDSCRPKLDEPPVMNQPALRAWLLPGSTVRPPRSKLRVQSPLGGPAAVSRSYAGLAERRFIEQHLQSHREWDERSRRSPLAVTQRTHRRERQGYPTSALRGRCRPRPQAVGQGTTRDREHGKTK